MKLIRGNEYQWWYDGIWVYDGLLKGGFTCDDCGKARQTLHRFYAKHKPDEELKLGSECVKEMKAVLPIMAKALTSKAGKGGIK